MENKILYGKEIALRLDEQLIAFVQECKEKGKRIPKLVNVTFKNSEASEAYLRGLKKKSEKIGVLLQIVELDEMTSEFEVIHTIHVLNNTSSIDGILLQMPLPSHLNAQKIIEEIHPNKDVDGLHPYNVGAFYQGKKSFVPCTALSAMEFIHESGIELEGKEVVVIGRSNVIGRPIAQLCLNENATVTIVHSKTKNIEKITSRADVVVAAVGQAKLVKKEWLKKGAVVIDVGINFDEEGKMCGDVDAQDVMATIRALSPVPKGVGVVTNSMLMYNLLEAYRRNR